MILQAADQLAQVRELFEKSLCAQALAAAEAIAPIRTWQGASQRILAGRLARNLGAMRLSNALHSLAYREHPSDPEACYYQVFIVLDRRGPLAAWDFVRTVGEDLPGASDSLRADWYAQHANLSRLLRDFDTAERWLDRAQNLMPDRAWLWIERAELFESEDRYDECLTAARKALELRPGYRPAVQATAHALQLLDRDDEALAVLEDAAAVTESVPILTQLALLQFELERYTQADQSLVACENLSPLMEKKYRRWIASRRSDIACALGDFDAAIALAKASRSPFHETLADEFAKPDVRAQKRVLLPVGFVRQHHMTCAPATLSTISRFWNMPADHLSVVEEICYDGTPHHSERNWAESHGWTTREFSVTWESAVALIDRGLPFTFTTVEPESGHLQAVVGYDARRGTLLIRDPFVYYVGEMKCGPALERWKPTGPRGMVLVPKDRAHLLEGIELKDAALWDLNHAVQLALAVHDREAALKKRQELEALAPDHPLAINAARAIAAYDGDGAAALAGADRLLMQFPEDTSLLLYKLRCLMSLGRRNECVQILEPLCKKRDSHPKLWQMYCDLIGPDTRQHDTLNKLLTRALKARPLDAAFYMQLGGIAWDQSRRERALELYRIAACLDDMDEAYSRTYFLASRSLRRTAEAIDHLKARVRRFGSRSSQSLRTLFWALEGINDTQAAFDVLEEGIKRRPDDGELLRVAANAYGRYGRLEEAEALLSRAKGRCPAQSLLWSQAEMADLRGDLALARQHLDAYCSLQPLHVDAQARLARLLSETESTAAAMNHLRAVCARFEHHYGLRQLLLQWLRAEAPLPEYEEGARQLVQLAPDDVWARRELTMALLRQNRHAEAMAELDTALAIDPNDAHTLALAGRVLLANQDPLAAQDLFRQAIRLSVDLDSAISGLLDACDTPQQKREALEFVAGELRRQTIFGDGLLAFRQHAASWLDPMALLNILREAVAERPDLWHAHSALFQQLAALHLLDEAAAVAKAATERFPLLPRIWIDLAQACQLTNDHDGELRAYERALQISPYFSYAVRELAGVHERRGNAAKARELLELEVKRSPLDAYNHGCLADVLWRLGERDAALKSLQHAVTLQPSYDWAWHTLRQWVEETQQPQLLESVARAVASQRPGEAGSWMILARNLSASAMLEERLDAVNQAIALSPRLTAAHDLKANLLALLGRTDEALAACRPAAYDTSLPIQLRHRRAKILFDAGQRDQAIVEMQAVVDDSPFDLNPTLSLLDWLRAGDDKALYLKGARQASERFPHDGSAWGYLGEAAERADKKDEAKAAYARAFALDPAYVFAGFSLADLQIHDKELDAARKTLQVIAPESKPEFIVYREVKIEAAARNRDAAAAKLLELCMLPFERAGMVQDAIDAMDVAMMNSVVDQTLFKAIRTEGVNPLTGELCMRRLAASQRYTNAVNLLDELIGQGPLSELGAFAARALISSAAEKKQRKIVARVIKQYRTLLHSHDLCWATVGYALTELDQMQKTVDWMSDWRSRSEAATPQWSLSNLAQALYRQNRCGEAAEVATLALTRDPDQTEYMHHLWLALEDARSGNIDALQARLKPLRVGEMQPFYQFIYYCLQAFCLADAITPQNRTTQLEKVRVEIGRADAVPGRANTLEHRWCYRHALLTVRRQCGLLRTPGWCHMRLLGLAGNPAAATQSSSTNSVWIYVVVAIIIVRALMKAISP